jgi:ComF family protein
VQGLLEILFPPSCLGCGRVLPGTAFFCEGCDAEVERLPRPGCPCCAEPSELPEPCPRCAARPPPFVRAFAPFVHGGPVSRAIHRFKYEDHPELARPLAELLAEEAATFLRGAVVRDFCAIPLHQGRLRDRRYDQSELLAGALAGLVGRPHLASVLRRTRRTERQVGLSESSRERNVAGAFRADPTAAGRQLLLVDDVFTTGATARAAASALLEAGARSVEILCLARAITG